ncbi:hypothetical protein [Candidatus Hodgkinia cicadicola]|uniref:hypothetical protein n=1 Tax=Candidatus Hodgkinia cicadicola TaxID=573658 RepID=UPI001788AD79
MMALMNTILKTCRTKFHANNNKPMTNQSIDGITHSCLIELNETDTTCCSIDYYSTLILECI